MDQSVLTNFDAGSFFFFAWKPKTGCQCVLNLNKLRQIIEADICVTDRGPHNRTFKSASFLFEKVKRSFSCY